MSAFDPKRLMRNVAVEQRRKFCDNSPDEIHDCCLGSGLLWRREGAIFNCRFYYRCMSDSSAFAKDENLNEVVADYLARIQREIDSSVHVSRVARMAGLEDQSKQARLRADQHVQELQQACAHLSQSMNATDRHPKADQTVPGHATQTAERGWKANFEHELNRRVPGAIFLMNEMGFSQWLDGKQGKTPRRDLWEQAVLAGDFEQAAQVLREYEREQKSK